MRQVLVAVIVLAFSSVALAEVPRRTFKSLGDVAYMPREGEASCGKASRDLIRDAVKAARTITVTSSHIRMNNGDAWKIGRADSESAYAGKSFAAPTDTHPNRVITMLMGVLVVGDDATFVMARSAESDGASCIDVYGVSIE